MRTDLAPALQSRLLNKVRVSCRVLLRPLLFLMLLSGILGNVAASTSVSLEWDQNSEPNVAGYKLYYGTASGVYSKTINAGNSTTVTVPDLETGTTYFFAVTAYDGTGSESSPSNEVVHNIPSPSPMDVALEWDPNLEPEVTGYKLYYGTVSGDYSRSVDAGNSTTTTVSDLVAGVTYYFVVTAYDGNGVESPPSDEIVFEMYLPSHLQLAHLSAGPPPGPGEPIINCVPNGAFKSDGFGIVTTAPAGSTISLYASSDLQTWTLEANLFSTTGRMLIKDGASVGQPHRFYRITRWDSE